MKITIQRLNLCQCEQWMVPLDQTSTLVQDLLHYSGIYGTSSKSGRRQFMLSNIIIELSTRKKCFSPKIGPYIACMATCKTAPSLINCFWEKGGMNSLLFYARIPVASNTRLNKSIKTYRLEGSHCGAHKCWVPASTLPGTCQVFLESRQDQMGLFDADSGLWSYFTCVKIRYSKNTVSKNILEQYVNCLMACRQTELLREIVKR